MTKSFATRVIFISMVLIGLSYATAFLPGGAPDWAAWVIAMSMSALMVAVLILGAAKGGAVRHTGLRVIFVLTFLALTVGFGLALRAPEVTPDAPLFMGLPHGAAIIMFVVGFLPMLVLPLAYALTFEETNLSDEELTELRVKLKELRP